jgi:hypothetical protein
VPSVEGPEWEGRGGEGVRVGGVREIQLVLKRSLRRALFGFSSNLRTMESQIDIPSSCSKIYLVLEYN